MVCQNNRATGRRTAGKGTKAYPTICKPIDNANRGLPKWESLKKAMTKGSEYPIWQRSFRSSLRVVTPLTWRREAVNAF